MTMIRMIGKRFFLDSRPPLFSMMHGRPHLQPQRCSARRTRVSLRTRLASLLGIVTMPTSWRRLHVR
jgi:hypothetical protein